jgi:hypothetical protein
MTVVAKALLMTHVADPAALVSLLPMIIAKVGVVVETLKIEIFVAGLMTISAQGRTFTKPGIRRVLGWWRPIGPVGNTSRQHYHRQQQRGKSDYFFQHLELS